jgi:hypothetical protein
MHHLCHVRGAGRFVLLARDSLPEANPSSGGTLDATNPGTVGWADSGIGEHHEGGMMLSFDVLPANAA